MVMIDRTKVFGVLCGVVSANFIEWGFHKYVLHGLGKYKSSVFSPHWHLHHRVARRQNMIDPFYQTGIFEQLKSYEVKSLALGSLALVPFAKKAPWFVGTILSYGVSYYFIHRASHLNSDWSKKWLPWHRKHHMGSQQDANWGVVLPVADYILGTAV